MREESCSLCGRAVAPTADECECGAKVDWLRRAPAALRAKLGRSAAVGAVIGTLTTACGGGCEAVLTDAGCAAMDVGCAARDAGCASDCGLDAYHMVDTGITESDCASPDVGPVDDANTGDANVDASADDAGTDAP